MALRMVWLAVAALALGTSAHARSPAEANFFRGKTITIVTSTGAGGTYDLLARELARRMPAYIPGRPNMIVENMPGAGNLLATNYMYNIAPKDGTTIATIHAAMPLFQVLDGRGVRFNVDKFGWLGSTGAENEVIIVWRTAGVKSFADVLKRPVVLGSTGAASGLSIIPLAMNNVLGAKFKLVLGYKSSEDLNLAMERGEVQARAFSMESINAQHRDWIVQKKIYVIAQAGAKREKDLPQAPLLTELAKTREQRQILQLVSSPPAFGHPFVAPPGTPPDRLAILRKAFAEALRDKIFLADVAKLHIAIDPISAAELTRLAHDVVSAPPEVVAKTKAATALPGDVAHAAKKPPS